ncbi:lactate racemase domain-containing protein [Chloroflexota bacterium]
MIVKLPQFAWDDPRFVDFPLPSSWQVEVHNIAGYDKPAMNDDQIKAAITNLMGMAPIRELARNKKEVVILFDDMTRVTRAAKIVPFILKELALAGISDDQIRFMAATGTHGPLNAIDFAKKLGADVVARYPVYNHNPHDNCTYVGTTSYGTKAYVNAEVMHCDFKIGIGSVTPHVFAAFSGGGKIVLPGVASLETTLANHTLPVPDETKRDYDANPRRRDIEEVAALAGLDVVVDCIVNMQGETVDLFAGARQEVAKTTVKVAKTHYLGTQAQDMDIVIANAYVKAGEANGVSIGVIDCLTKDGGDIVVIGNSPEGSVSHYLMGSWGRTIGGKLNMRRPIAPQINHYIFYSQYPTKTSVINVEPKEKALLMSRWDDVVNALLEYHGDHARVAVYPSADLQYFG